ncbi:hypothetical protein SRABI128_00544 [Microbacterium sp. Bi128]|nr:hypothetical protein SRABI128_00544 [Microbacterium sp. Bi128]
MRGSSGPVSGTICTMPVSAVSLGVARATSATPGIFATSSPMFCIRVSGSLEVTIVPVMMSGPFAPGPKYSSVSS